MFEALVADRLARFVIATSARLNYNYSQFSLAQ